VAAVLTMYPRPSGSPASGSPDIPWSATSPPSALFPSLEHFLISNKQSELMADCFGGA